MSEVEKQWDFFRLAGYDGSETISSAAVTSYLQGFLSPGAASYFLTGSVAETTRGSGNPTSSGILYAELGDFTDYGIGAIQAHSICLASIMTYAEQEKAQSGFLNFKSVLGTALPLLFNDDLAIAAGATPALLPGESGPAGKLQAALAYSALEGDGLVFGDTGIRAYFNDLSALGSKVESNANFLQEVDSAIIGSEIGADTLSRAVVEAITQFAGQLALRKVAMANAENAIDGIIHFANGGTIVPGLSQGAADLMFIDMSPLSWRLGITNPAAGSNLPSLLTDWLETLLVSQFKNHPVGGVGPDALVYDTSSIADANLFGMFYSVYDAPDNGRLWTDARSPGQYLNGVAFLDPDASGPVTLVDFQTALGTTTGNAAVMVVCPPSAPMEQFSVIA